MDGLKFFLVKASLASLLLLIYSCDGDDDNKEEAQPAPQSLGQVAVGFNHLWGPEDDPFGPNDTLVHPITGEEIYFTTLKYYLSNFVLHGEDGSDYRPTDSYYLLDISGSSNTELIIPRVPLGNYMGISFTIGVDSLRNTSGAQDGALSVSNLMFWSWTTGYIFIMAEGHATSNNFVYHVGGFEEPHIAIRTLYFPFDGNSIEVMENETPGAEFKVDVSAIWDEFTPMASVSTPSSLASRLATNFSEGFDFDHIHN